MSPPSRAAWIEIVSQWASMLNQQSPPSRAAWIEIAERSHVRLFGIRRRLHGRRGLKSREADVTLADYVAAFTGGVD